MDILNDILTLSILDHLFSYWPYIRMVLSLIATVGAIAAFVVLYRTHRYYVKEIYPNAALISKRESEIHKEFVGYLVDSGYMEQVIEDKEDTRCSTLESIHEVAKGRTITSTVVFAVAAFLAALLSAKIAVLILCATGYLVAKMTLLQRDHFKEYHRYIDLVIEEEPQ